MNTKEGTFRQATEAQREVFELPLELKAMNEAMNMVFEAIAAPQKENPANRILDKSDRSVSEVSSAAAAPRRMDIEAAIMSTPEFDYLVASEIFAALHKRLELRYENNLNTELEARLKKLSEAFDRVT